MRTRAAFVALFTLLAPGAAACVGSRADVQEAPSVPTASQETHVTRVREYRSHEPRPAEETAEGTRECDAGKLVACHGAALDAYYSAPSPETDARARALFQKACDGGYAPSCNGLGVLYAAGRGVTQDLTKALSLYRRACESDGSTGCQHLADALRHGRGVAKDKAAADRAEARGKCLFEVMLAKDGGPCPALDAPPP